ncbi:NADPH:quinone reductase [Acuticoccus mangrovi]|uniref:NADPH:quinone reductase n=1 Tax=Acuticoccus mangrovi TaxID=2796142 RepID=A0A934IUV3_9HYPH|nr:NADPH:quinone reductase [Acuticoccus mangrovi]MBJ3778149.1 NADPH:quinone reductase [Acuticoccus mangrovi]
MKAAWYERTGPAHEVLTVGEIPAPTLAAHEVLVRVRASAVNPADHKRRSGWLGTALGHRRIVPHMDGAGEIVAVGAEVAPGRVGERVFVYGAQGGYDGDAGRAFGTAAQYCALPAAQALALPDTVGFAEAAGLPVPAFTAFRAVFGDGSVAGKAVLVAGGAGAVAQYAINFAKTDGARLVLATVSSAQKGALALEAGADAVIDYRTEDVARRVLALAGGPVERIVEVDFAANLALDVEVIANNGTIATYSSSSEREPAIPYYPLQWKGVTVRFVRGSLLTETMLREAVERIGRMATAGTLHHPPRLTFPLERIADAHVAAETGAFAGKIILEID